MALVKGTKQIPLKYEYDELSLRNKSDKTYKANENYAIYIDYTAKPDEYQEKYGTNGFLGIN